MNPPILVTGGAGFIGSHLVERLLQDGASVVVLDDFSTGRATNLGSVASHPQLEIISSKVSNYPGLPDLIARSKFVFHLAAAVGVNLVVQSPIQTIHNNLLETEVVLQSAAPHKVPVLLASTSEVYGKSTKPSFSENDDLLIGPPHLGRWSYACSKLMDEFMGLAYTREMGLPVIIARFFNTVGPRQVGQYGMVLPRFIEAALAGEPLKVYGDGRQSRCFCYVKDTVEALVRLMRCPQAVGEVFNIGSTEEITIAGLADEIIRQLGSASQVEYIPYAEAYAPGFEDMLRRKPAMEKLAATIGFAPATPLSTIIAATAEHLKERPQT